MSALIRPLTVRDLVDPAGRHSDVDREPVLDITHGALIFLDENLVGMDRRHPVRLSTCDPFVGTPPPP